MNETTRALDIDGDVFTVLEEGQGPPVLFLHGALADARIWRPHLAALGSRARGLAYTQRGFGRGPWRADGPPFGVETHAADLGRVVEALGLGPVRLVAWSYAGHVALEGARRRPDLFAALTLYEPGVRTFPLDEDEARLVAQDAGAMFGPIVEAVARGDMGGAARLLLEASGEPGDYDRLPSRRRAVYDDNAPTMAALLSQTPPPAMTAGDLAALPMPAHVLWGERSRPAARLPACAVARAIPRGRHGEVPGVGHLWPEEAPDAFVGAVVDRFGL